MNRERSGERSRVAAKRIKDWRVDAFRRKKENPLFMRVRFLKIRSSIFRFEIARVERGATLSRDATAHRALIELVLFESRLISGLARSLWPLALSLSLSFSHH